MSETPETDTFMTRIRGIDGDKHWVPANTSRRLERERDMALKQLESTKMRMEAERTAAREAIDAAEAERDKAYEQFYQNPDAAKHEREKAERQNAEWQEKWEWSSNAFAQLMKKNEQLEEEISKLKSKYE